GAVHGRARAGGALDSRLAAVAAAHTVAAGMAAARTADLATAGARVRVMLEAKRAAAVAAVAAAGGTVERTSPELTQALVSPHSLDALAAAPGVERLPPPALFRAD